MFGSARGPLGALLMIAPLAAIPLFSIVGIPEFAPVSASPAEDEEVEHPAAPAPARQEPPRAPPSRSALDLYAPIESAEAPQRADPRTRQPSADVRNPKSPPVRADSILPPEALDDWEVAPTPRDRAGAQETRPARRGRGFGMQAKIDEGGLAEPEEAAEVGQHLPDAPRTAAGRRADPRARFDEGVAGRNRSREFRPDLLHPGGSPDSQGRPPASRGDARSPAAKGDSTVDRERAKPRDIQALEELESSEQSGWKNAAKRLKAHGIVKYRLESQIERQRFLFRCEYPTPDDSHVTELFEAIAETPLDAVLETLKQIDEWLDQGDRVDREGAP